MPERGLWAKSNPILATQPETEIDVLSCRVGEALVEGKLARGKSLHAEVKRRHVPQFPPVWQQPLSSQRAIHFVIPIKKCGPPRIGHAPDRRELRLKEKASHVGMPVAVKNAVVIREEDLVVTSRERLGHCNVPGSRGTAVCWKPEIIDVAVRQGVLQRACVVHHVDVGECRRLLSNAVEQTAQAPEVPPSANETGNDQCAHEMLGPTSLNRATGPDRR